VNVRRVRGDQRRHAGTMSTTTRVEIREVDGHSGERRRWCTPIQRSAAGSNGRASAANAGDSATVSVAPREAPITVEHGGKTASAGALRERLRVEQRGDGRLV
jgi:hypothetical protein